MKSLLIGTSCLILGGIIGWKLCKATNVAQGAWEAGRDAVKDTTDGFDFGHDYVTPEDIRKGRENLEREMADFHRRREGPIRATAEAIDIDIDGRVKGRG